MNQVVIIGGGFAGLSALKRLAREKKDLEITLIDRKTMSDFLPALPDAIGRCLPPQSLSLNLKTLAKRLKTTFVSAEVNHIDPAQQRVLTAEQSFSYDYLIIASGAETNFYGNSSLQKHCFTVDSVPDVERILLALSQRCFEYCLVIGGGYTGIEVATNLWRHFKREKKSKKIIIIEKAPALLGPLPPWIKENVTRNLEKMGIEVFCNVSLERLEGQTVFLSNQRRFDAALVIWTAGVKTAEYIIQSRLEKRAQGRIAVDKYLRAHENCFVIGDAACFNYRGTVLRMAVQFAITEGEAAAHNILRTISGQPLLEYKPVDLGYIVPMANNRACGKLLCLDVAGVCPFKNSWVCGKLVCVELRGHLAVTLHYFMCLVRLPGFSNKIAMLKALLS